MDVAVVALLMGTDTTTLWLVPLIPSTYASTLVDGLGWIPTSTGSATTVLYIMVYMIGVVSTSVDGYTSCGPIPHST